METLETSIGEDDNKGERSEQRSPRQPIGERGDPIIPLGANAIEMECKDGKEWIMALHSNVGFGIGCLEVDEGRFFLKEMEEMKKKRQVTLTGKRYRLVFSEYESFGEWVYRIEMKEVNRTNVSRERKDDLHAID